MKANDISNTVSNFAWAFVVVGILYHLVRIIIIKCINNCKNSGQANRRKKTKHKNPRNITVTDVTDFISIIILVVGLVVLANDFFSNLENNGYTIKSPIIGYNQALSLFLPVSSLIFSICNTFLTFKIQKRVAERTSIEKKRQNEQKRCNLISNSISEIGKYQPTILLRNYHILNDFPIRFDDSLMRHNSYIFVFSFDKDLFANYLCVSPAAETCSLVINNGTQNIDSPLPLKIQVIENGSWLLVLEEETSEFIKFILSAVQYHGISNEHVTSAQYVTLNMAFRCLDGRYIDPTKEEMNLEFSLHYELKLSLMGYSSDGFIRCKVTDIIIRQPPEIGDPND